MPANKSSTTSPLVRVLTEQLQNPQTHLLVRKLFSHWLDSVSEIQHAAANSVASFAELVKADDKQPLTQQLVSDAAALTTTLINQSLQFWTHGAASIAPVPNLDPTPASLPIVKITAAVDAEVENPELLPGWTEQDAANFHFSPLVHGDGAALLPERKPTASWYKNGVRIEVKDVENVPAGTYTSLASHYPSGQPQSSKPVALILFERR
jgi:hypothetical protein